MSLDNLPVEWLTTSIENIADVKGGKRLPKGKVFALEKTDHPYIRVTDMSNGGVDLSDLRYIDEETYKHISNYIISKDDLYISIAGTIGLVGGIPDCLDGANLTENAAKICNLKGIENSYLKYVLNSQIALDQFDDKVTSSGQPKLALFRIRDCLFPYPPLAEQQEIVRQLDVMLTQVEQIKARLDVIPAILKKFRQSVLADAVSGKIGKDNLSLADDGYPLDWGRLSFSELGSLSRGKSKHRPRNDSRLFGNEYPFIQTGEVANSDGLITEAHKFYSEFGLQQSKLFPKGTLCITIAANIADTAILGIDACFPDSVVGFIADKDKCDTQFIKYFIDVNKQNLEKFAPATAQKNINLKILNALELPIPSLESQKSIVGQVEQYLRLIKNIEVIIESAQKRVNLLTQSILGKAFSGELTAEWREQHQDLITGINSAEALLAKIQAEREASKPVKKTRAKKEA